MFMVQAASSIIYKTSSSSFYGSVLCRSDQDMAMQTAMLLQTQISVCVLCVTPGSQEHDSPYGVLGGRATAVSATARFASRPGRRCGSGAVGAPEFLTEGLLDLVSPGALPGLQLRWFHGCLPAFAKRPKRNPSTGGETRLNHQSVCREMVVDSSDGSRCGVIYRRGEGHKGNSICKLVRPGSGSKGQRGCEVEPS